MKHLEFSAHNKLTSFIDAYWEITCEESVSSVIKALPDGCVDIIINLGDDFVIENENIVLKSEKAYLAGAITSCKEVNTLRETRLIGVRFKPGAFSHFYAFSSLHEATNNFVELSNDFVPKLNSFSSDISSTFDSYYYNKLIQTKNSLLPVIETINKHRGNVSVIELADRHFTTVKQLERHFKYQIGLSPKEFLNTVRYKFAQQLILMSQPRRPLYDIAYECGYYDQAHLCKEIKKYTGVVPSSL